MRLNAVASPAGSGLPGRLVEAGATRNKKVPGYSQYSRVKKGVAKGSEKKGNHEEHEEHEEELFFSFVSFVFFVVQGFYAFCAPLENGNINDEGRITSCRPCHPYRPCHPCQA